MAKTKQKKTVAKSPAGGAFPAESSQGTSKEDQRESSAKWWREAVESVVVAIVLALLFRTFEAEAFVIPTGSMAPTLQGRHKDVQCGKCGYWYQVGASEENESPRQRGVVQATTCPMCRYPMALDLERDDHGSFTGDRILVNKFAYQFGEPQRWDVIVFKFPGNAKQNYIKRLVGLPGETVRIKNGDIYIRQEGAEEFQIARKPAAKLRTMLQLVHDTDYIPMDLIRVGWPARWQPAPSASGDPAAGWTVSSDRRQYQLAGEDSQQEAWLRYRHVVPSMVDWDAIETGVRPASVERQQGQLISDFYPYNAGIHRSDFQFSQSWADIEARSGGLHWVGDLAVECELQVDTPSGEVLMDLVEGGRHYQCRIDVSDGSATLTIDGGRGAFAETRDGEPVRSLTASTRLRGPGSYRLRFANADDQLVLWVNDRVIPFGSPDEELGGIYKSADEVQPAWSPEDPGDLAPARIGGKGIQMTLTGLRVLRDVYYIATRDTRINEPAMDYELHRFPSGSRYASDQLLAEIQQVLADPPRWNQTPLFRSRRMEEFTLGKDEFFPLGDNSPQSKDARLWHSLGPPRVDASVHRELLTGKAFLVYWPHPWYLGTRYLPIVPNVSRMGLIR